MKKFEEKLEQLKNNSHTNFYGYMGIRLLTEPEIIETFKDWVSPEDHQAEIKKIELQNLKYREEIARMQKALRKKNKAIKELNGAVKKTKARLKECEKLRIEANNEAASEYSRKCEVVEERSEFKREIEKLKSQLEKQQPEIPEFVGKYIKETADPIHEMCAWSEHYGDNGTKCDEPELSKMLDWFGMNRNMFYEAVIKGYTVKEKRFYLKNKLTGLYLTLNTGENEYYEHHHDCALKNQKGWKYKFTQQEIDSMETGSYEQIEVEE